MYIYVRLLRDRKTGVGNWAGSIASTYEFARVNVQFDVRFIFYGGVLTCLPKTDA